MKIPKTENEIKEIFPDWDDINVIEKKIILMYIADGLKLQDLIQSILRIGRHLGFPNILNKYKWREVAIAENRNHTAHNKSSYGGKSTKSGSDATDSNGKRVEYKSENTDKNSDDIKIINGVLGKGKWSIRGVYNNAFQDGAIEKYKIISHEYSQFSQERLIVSIKVNNETVIGQLTENRDANNLYMETGCMRKGKNGKYFKGPSRCKQILRSFNGDVEKARKHIKEDLGYDNRISATTNGNSVNVCLKDDQDKFVYSYVDEEWFKKRGVNNIIQILTDKGMYNAD